MSSFISDRANSLGESVTLKMARLARELKAKGKDVISLSLGEPDFNTPDYLKEAAKVAIDENNSFYTPVPGTMELRSAIVNKFKRDNGFEVNEDQIVVSTGAKQSIMNVILATVNPGDEVILPTPFWVSYIEMVKFAGGIPVLVETSIETDFKITKEQLRDAISDKTKCFLFSNPCNPSGSSYTKEELNSLVKVFKEYDFLIISDEIYEYINFERQNISLATFREISDRVITVNGLSKGYAMTGWRLGFLSAPLEVAKACSKIQGQFTSGANAIAQKTAVTALNEGPSKILFMKDIFLKRRDLFIEHLSKIEGIKLNKPGGAFYIFPDISYFLGKSFEGRKIENSEDLCMLILDEAMVAATPGSAFGSSKNIRLSYATSDELLIEAARRIKEVLNQLK
ncbi:MAG: pyridoxal phosphate-dependent aminotransferase [Bacteriovoracaceae bacterium]|nr:pyridoxal phosphate-dependent aminotransferase [Bacteriovoracaceae bacterium]